MSVPASATMDQYLANPRSITLDSTNQTFHKYTVCVRDTKKIGSARTHVPLVLQATIKTDATPATQDPTGMVEFPSGSMPHRNHHLRVTKAPVLDTRPPGTASVRHVEDVFFLVKMHDAKVDRAESVSGYIEITSGGTKGGTKENRKWISFDKPEPHFFPGGNLSFEEKLRTARPDSYIPPNVVDREFAVYFEHDKIDLNDLSGMVNLPSGSVEAQQAQHTLQESIDHYTSQLIEARLKELQTGCNPIIRGNRVFVKPGSDAHGLQEMAGVQGKVVYRSRKHGSILVEPCTGYFFQDILVSDFLQRFFGSNITGKADDDTLKRISNVLRGVQVVVAGPTGQPGITSPIIGFGHVEGESPDSLHPIADSSVALKFPDMPLVDVGSTDHPNYRPAELCKIVGGCGKEQIFNGKLPLSLYDDNFQLLPPIAKPPKILPTGDPFPVANVDGFKLYFVNLTTTSNGKTSRAVRDDVMASVKEEIGNRYGNRLAQAVRDCTDLEATPEGLGGALGFHDKYRSGSRSVLIVVTPEGLSHGEIGKIQFDCHSRWGMQCCIIDGKQATRRYHPIDKVPMVKYTGGRVRAMFGKALIPSEEDHPPGKPVSQGRTIGIHVHQQSSDYYLIGLIVIPKGGQVCVRNDIFGVCDEDGLALKLASYIQQDHESEPGLFTSVFLSGLGVKSERVLSLLNEKLDGWLSCDTSKSPVRILALTAVAPESRIHMAEKDKHIVFDSYCNALPSVPKDGGEVVDKVRNFTNLITDGAYNIKLPVGLPQTAYSPSLERYIITEISPASGSSVQSGDREEILQYTYAGKILSTYQSPAILHLAQESSKHSRLFVFEKASGKHVFDPVSDKTEPVKKLTPTEKKAARAKAAEKAAKSGLRYDLKKVHPALKDTFYFL